MSFVRDPNAWPVTVLDPGDCFTWGGVTYEVIGINEMYDVLALNTATGEITQVFPQMYVTVVPRPTGSAGV